MKNKIQLNSIWYDLAKSEEKLAQSLPAWEADIFAFLVEWFSVTETVSLQTSGSTGTPKKITKAKSALRHSAMLTGTYFGFEPSKTALLCLPAKYIAGKMMLVRAIEWQLSLDYIEPKINLKIPESNYFFSAMTPQQAQANILHLRAIEYLIVGGAPISQNLEQELIGIPTQVFATYGMTETVSHIALRKLALQADSNSYTVLKDVTIQTDKRDCLQIQAPELHPEKITTNDIVEITSKNTFRWKGRFDHIINSGGVKISPERMEGEISKFISTPFIIAGLPDKNWGEKIILILEGKSFDTDEIKEQIASVLKEIEQPKAIYFLPKFIRTENQKVRRKPTLELVKSETTNR